MTRTVHVCAIDMLLQMSDAASKSVCTVEGNVNPVVKSLILLLPCACTRLVILLLACLWLVQKRAKKVLPCNSERQLFNQGSDAYTPLRPRLLLPCQSQIID